MTNFLRSNKDKLKAGVRMYSPPFGYDVTEEGYLVPIEEDLAILEEIAEMLEYNALSMREASLWISDKASRPLSREGLKIRLRRPIRLETEETNNGI